MQVYYNKAECADAAMPAFRKIKSADVRIPDCLRSFYLIWI